jgi:hypothetical protein
LGRKKFGSKRKNVTGDLEKQLLRQVQDIHPLPETIRETNSMNMRCVGHLAFMRENKNAYEVLTGQPEVMRPL